MALYYLVLFFSFIVGAFFIKGVPEFAPDQLFLLLVSLVVILEKGGEMILSFSKYFILFISYEAMSGMAFELNSHANYLAPIAFDRFIGNGEIPNTILQHAFSSVAPAVDLFATVFYASHFLMPILFGVFLWLKRKEWYEPYFLAFIIASYIGLISFLLFPVAPPWMAAQQGLVDVHHILLEGGDLVFMPTLYALLNVNPVAAFPSMHFVYPLIITYFAIRAFGKPGYLVVLYPLAMGFSLVYLGEHYVFDLAGSVICATSAILISQYVQKVYAEGTLPKVYAAL